MTDVLLCAQIVSIFLLFLEAIYIACQNPSKVQMRLLLFVISTLFMLTGYLVEIVAEDVDTAMVGVAFAYVGKTYALMFSLLFTSEYCGRTVPKKLIVPMALYHLIYPVLIFTNNFHHLYYSWVEFDRSRPISPLRLGHGPLYYLYMLTICVNFIITLVLTIREFMECTTRRVKEQVLYIFGMIFSSVVGYVVFLTGRTGGYDTTMIGAFIGVVFLSVLFLRCRLFDSLTIAKDHALEKSANGLLVLDKRGNTMYSNLVVNQLLKGELSMEEMRNLPFGVTELHKGGRIYEASKNELINRDRVLGTTIELFDITDRYNYSTKLEQEVKQRTQEIRHIQRSVLASFAEMVEARDNATGVHIKNVSDYVGLIAGALVGDGQYTDQLNGGYIDCLIEVAPLHDIGKMSIPDRILLKPGGLTAEEFEVMKTHTTQGAYIIGECLEGVEQKKYVEMAGNVAMYHHERWDGSGYPNGLAGTAIPLSARITALADVYDAVRSKRCYKDAVSCADARDIIAGGRGTQFDPVIVDAFMSVLPEIEAVSNQKRQPVC